MPTFGNYILDEVSAAIPGGFDSSIVRTVFVNRGHLIGQPGVPLEAVYFPQTALISATIEFSSGSTVGGVLIGSEGVFGADSTFGVKAPVFSSAVQRAGTCWLMPIPELCRLVRSNHQIAAVLFRYQHFLLAQAQQIAACATKHDIRARLCSYLLRVRDESNQIKLVQESLAEVLGVRRTSVSAVASDLRTAGIIRSHRGRIFIADVERLRASACECHAAIDAFKDALLSPAEGLEDTATVGERTGHILSTAG